MKLQRPQSRVLRTVGNLDRRTPVRDLHLAFKIPYVCDYVTKLCRRQAEVILNHENPNYMQLDKDKAGLGSTKGFNLAAVRPTTVQVFDCHFWRLNNLRHRLLHSPALTEVPVCIITKCWIVFCEWWHTYSLGEGNECNLRWNRVW
jgi:hypothetical protein